MAPRKQEPDWHHEARRLRAEGMDPGDIARRLGRHRTRVNIALDEHGEREKELARQRNRRSRGNERSPMNANGGWTERRITREPQPSDGRREAAIKEATLAFAQNQISRVQLVERLKAI